jgi:predicted PurR-regulated permease PerM
MVLGMKQYALLIGFVAGAANFIPYLGPLMGEIPAILYVLLSNNYEGPKEKLLYTGLVIGLFALIQTLDGFVFQPKIVGKSAQLHPVVVILALVVGGQFGIMGMIVAVPTACILRVLIKEFYWDQRMASTRQREKAS